jgi:uncharacterized protein (TIGR02996 family)
MSTRAAFLQAIHDNPDDDTLRLVYADWLEEQGDPQAELIRVQCRLARLDADDPERGELDTREREMLKRHSRDWLGPSGNDARGWSFQRGILTSVTIPVPLYLEHGEELRQIKPTCEILLDLSDAEIPQSFLSLVPESVARETVSLPLGKRKRILVMAVEDPAHEDTHRMLQFILNRRIEPVKAPREQLIQAIIRHYGNPEFQFVDTAPLPDESMHPFYVEDWEERMGDDTSPFARVLELMLMEAYRANSTRVQIEPVAGVAGVYFWVNGWRYQESLPLRLLEPVLGRLRFLAGRKEAAPVTRESFSLRFATKEGEYNISGDIYPTPYGPRILLTL